MRSVGIGKVLRLACFALVVVAISTMAGGCRSVRNAVTATVQSEDGNIWRLSNGKILLLVDAQHGRIIHYGLRNNSAGIRINQNLIWNNPEAENPQYIIGGWKNWGGDKIWVWPQTTGAKYSDSWAWPPPEPADGYKVEPTPNRMGLIMTSGVLPGYGIRIIRKIEITEETTSVVITSQFEQLQENFGRPIGMWSVTQIPTPDEFYARLPLISDRNRLMAADNGFQKQASGSVVKLQQNPSGEARAFMNADIMAAVLDDVVFLQRQIPAQREGIWNDDEKAQLNAHPIGISNIPAGPNYMEIGWTSPMVPQSQLQNTTLKVVWKLMPLEKDTTSQQIQDMISKLP